MKSPDRQFLMTDSQQQAEAILDQLAFMPFEQCLAIDRQFDHLPARPGIYTIRHRTEAGWFHLWR